MLDERVTTSCCCAADRSRTESKISSLFIVNQGEAKRRRSITRRARTLESQPPRSATAAAADHCDRRRQRRHQGSDQSIFLVTVCLALATLYWCCHCCWQQASAQQSPILPTVIVRGFLNYRTTVDGTVLLFTPDAGGSAASQAPSSSAISLLPTSTIQQPIEPTSVERRQQQQQRLVSATALPTTPDESSSSNASGRQAIMNNEPPIELAGGDQWRSVKATPPLQSDQAGQVRPSPVATAGSLESALAGEPEQQAQRQPAGAQPVSRQANADHLATRSTPSVQADDVLVAGVNSGDQQQAAAPAVVAATAGAPPSTSTARASRPKRPQLGFSGQSSRSRATLRSQINEASQSTNTINGIRRPGLAAATSSTTPAASLAQEASTSANMVAFQNRLTSASAKLRNKLRRQPFGANKTNSSATDAPAPATLTAAAVAPVASSQQPEQQPGSSGQFVSGVLQPAESGEELVIGDQLPAAQAQGISPDSQASGASGENGSNQLLASQQLASTTPTVGSDEVLGAMAAAAAAPIGSPVAQGGASGGKEAGQASESAPAGSASEPLLMADKPISRSGEQRPRDLDLPSGGLTDQLQQGQLGNTPLSFDAFFQGEQGGAGGGSAESHQAAASDRQASHQQHQQKNGQPRNNNEKLNGWLDQHPNKLIARPPPSGPAHGAGHLPHQLAANLNSLAPSFAANIPLSSAAISQMRPTPSSATTGEALKLADGGGEEASGSEQAALSTATSSEQNKAGQQQESLQLQTITKTYSTVMTTFKTRLVPLQVKSSTAIHTITENYVITKMLTAYQTMPVGEFILDEPPSTRAPFELFNEAPSSQGNELDRANQREQPISLAPGSLGAPTTSEQAPQQEQPISLDSSNSPPRSSNDWLHDFSNMNSANSQSADQQQQQQQQAIQQQQLAALLERQAQEANLAGFSLGEPLDQLASSLDPAALLADGSISIPDLNNPLVLAAAIQNPQLAAVILAAQQLQLKQRNNKLANGNQNQSNNQIQPAFQLQPSYSTSLSTAIRPSTYTARDTMYTTRLVSFKDGRTVRTRTVSEPGSVIEQVLTTMATEVTPITITIRPSGVLGRPSMVATAGGNGPNQLQQQATNQATINNALIATQLASLLARRQQQVQPGLSSPAGFFPAAGGVGGSQAPLGQLAALQQLVGKQQQQQAVRQFQPNLQQLLQSMQQPGSSQNSQAAAAAAAIAANKQTAAAAPNSPMDQKRAAGGQQELNNAAPTPMLPVPVPIQTLPITTTLTNLQVRTYTVHNAFKTIYRTITSTQLITSTIFPAAPSTQMPNLG